MVAQSAEQMLAKLNGNQNGPEPRGSRAVDPFALYCTVGDERGCQTLTDSK